MPLCSNRPEGFGPHSHIHPSLPTTCFSDTIVIPLATWIFMILSVVPIVTYLRSDGRGRDSSPEKSSVASPPARRSWLQRVLTAIYYVLLLAMLAMQALVIARLAIAHLGIGLLPFTFVGVLLAGICHLLVAKSSMVARGVTALYWLMLAAGLAIQLAALVEEEGMLYNRRGVAGKYPLGDEVTDTGVMIGVAVVLAVLEFLTR